MITCTFENGNPAKKGLRHVTLGAIAVNEKNQVLLVKRGPTVPRPHTYSVPGGFMDRDENTEQGILRELKEETGFDGKIRFLFHINDSPARPKEDRQNIDFIYVVDITSDTIHMDYETEGVYWFDKENLPTEEEFAFDHRATILKFFEYLEKTFQLPLIGKL